MDDDELAEVARLHLLGSGGDDHPRLAAVGLIQKLYDRADKAGMPLRDTWDATDEEASRDALKVFTNGAMRLEV